MNRNKSLVQMLMFSLMSDNIKINKFDTGFKPIECLTVGTYLSLFILNGNLRYILKVIELFI
jgi:hypothetical protein